MANRITLDDLKTAWAKRDPGFADLFVALVNQPNNPDAPVRSGAFTFDQFVSEIRSWSFSRKTEEEQRSYRVATMATLEAPNAEVPLEPKHKSYEILLALWESDEPFARRCLLDVIQKVPLVYGPWRGIKRIYKEAEAKRDTEIFGAISARLDVAANGWGHQVTGGTLAYLSRRAWRFLRHTGTQLPATYVDAACDFLVRYKDEDRLQSCWILNHILYHNSKQYGRGRFYVWSPPNGGTQKNRAYPELWQRSPRPLFRLLEQAQAEVVFKFATDALKNDFRAVLRDVEPAWVARLVNVNRESVHSFVVWILNNVPKFEQGKFRELGLHEGVLRLFDSPSNEARTYAANYARAHARDLTIDQLIRLIDNDNEAIKKLAADLIQGRDARTEIGLEAWGRLLETNGGHKLAADALKKHFGPKELTPEWFANQLFSPSYQAYEFVVKLLPQVHKPAELGPNFFADLIDRIKNSESDSAERVSEFALKELGKLDLNTLGVDFIKRLYVNPLTNDSVIGWVNGGKLKPNAVGLDYLKALAFRPDWDAEPFLTALRNGDGWGRDIEFNDYHATEVRTWLADPRKFLSTDIGIDWLLRVVQYGEEQTRLWASDFLTKAFRPADFAPKTTTTATTGTESAAPATADLKKATFLFTGKLSTMNRKEAEEKVKSAGGVVAGSVGKNLAYLVIGDEGSPLYGQGAKGDKQTKAEDLNSKGANIAIISETAFLKMLTGADTGPPSADALDAGCQRLWEMSIAPGGADAPLGMFARSYIRKHHKEIAASESDRPVDPGTEVPEKFFSFERFNPLFSDSRGPLREFALDIAKFEFARWAPASHELVAMCELPFGEVRRFVAQALLDEPHPKNKRYRINPDTLSPAAVYRFCESANEATRAIGLQLIDRSPRLKVPEELFRLTESPDRKVRAFVVRALWHVYRDRGVTPEWKPPIPPATSVGSAARKKAAKAVEDRGPGVPPQPDHRPAGDSQMTWFLRRVLFEIPPGRMEPASEEDKAIFQKLKPLPARKAKLSLVDVMRDLALEDAKFAEAVLPVFTEFMGSYGIAERNACLVAVTRIKAKWPQKG